MISFPGHTARQVLIEVVLTVSVGVAWAQGCPSPTGPPARPGSPQWLECERRGQALFAEYQAKYRGTGAQGAEALLKVMALGQLARTPQNTVALRALLTSQVTVPEKIGLVRLLGRQHGPGDPTGMNHLILADLRQAATAPDNDLALAAVFAFSRSGWTPDSEAVLSVAWKRGLLDDDGYYGEIAHLTMSATDEDQARLVRTLRAGMNRYSLDIVLSGVTGGLPLGRAARAELLRLAQAMEPQLGTPVSQYGAFDGFRYADWLLSLAMLKYPDSSTEAAEFVMRTIDQPSIDPRKVAAVLTSSRAASMVIATIGVRSRFDRMLEILARYPGQHPDNVALRDLAENARDAVARNTR